MSVADEDLLTPLLMSLPQGLPKGVDLRGITIVPLLDWDEESLRGLVSLNGGDDTWLWCASDAYWPDVVGNDVIVLRNIHTGKGTAILGAMGGPFPYPENEEPDLPGRGTVTSVPGTGRVVVEAGGESFTARTVQSYSSPGVGDVVALVWDDRESVSAVGRIVTWNVSAPSRPSAPVLTRSGSKAQATWTKPSNVDTTRIRFRYRGGGWTTKTGLTGRTFDFYVAEGRTREVQIAQANAGGLSSWSELESIDGPSASKPPPKPPKPTYKTVSTNISPTSTGTFRDSVNRWDDWNRGRYGYPYSLYQGSQYGSGPMLGLATYGSKIKNLRAVEILKIEVRLVDARLGEYTVGQPIRLRATSHGSRPSGRPNTSSGATQTATLGKGDSRWVNLDFGSGVREQFRTGDLRGLVVDGGPYRAVRGRGTSGMTLRVTYRRRT